jgi:hypothetical protein
MDDVCKLSVRGLVTEDLCHSEDSERGRELDHMATDQQSMRLISSLLLLHQRCVMRRTNAAAGGKSP